MARDTPTRLIRAAERLFAERGIAGVTSDEIRREAGQRNASAINYHFGDRIGLIRAIIEYRADALRCRRQDLFLALADQAEPSLYEVARTLVDPFVEECRDPDSWYIGFLAQVMPERDLATPHRPTGDPESPLHETVRFLERHVHDLSHETLELRVRFSITLVVNTLAAQQFAESQAMATMTLDRTADELIRAVAALIADPIVGERRSRTV